MMTQTEPSLQIGAASSQAGLGSARFDSSLRVDYDAPLSENGLMRTTQYHKHLRTPPVHGIDVSYLPPKYLHEIH